MTIEKIAILDLFNAFADKLAGMIRSEFPGSEVFSARDIDQLAAQTNDIDVLITWPFIDEKVERFCQAAPSLKWVHAFTAGVDGIVQSKLNDMAIEITATKGIHGPAISDHVIAFIFSFLRSLPALREFQHNKIWYRSHEHPDVPELAVEESFDKTVGVVGLGSIGTCIARKCKQLGMRVLATKRTPADSDWVDECYSPDDLDKLLKTSDFVVIATPLTRETEKMIGQRQLQVMKNSAYLINISRGGCIDEPELVKALQDKQIAGCALDTVEHEPLAPSSKLWTMPNVLITPHISANSTYSKQVRAYQAIIDNIRRFVQNEPLSHIVDRDLGY